ncbi:MAG TPA: hypothetical protein VII84_09470 [Acidimicrobiales bacterium]
MTLVLTGNGVGGVCVPRVDCIVPAARIADQQWRWVGIGRLLDGRVRTVK